MRNFRPYDLFTKARQADDSWCERRAIKPLQCLLRAYPAPLIHTDQKHQLLEALRDVKGLHRVDLTEDELRQIVELHNALERSLSDHATKHRS
jgi:hypothetical protein